MQTPQYPEVHIAQYPEQHDLCHPPPPQPAVATATPIAVARPVPAVAAAASPSQPMLPAEEQLSTCSGKVSLGGGDALPARLRLGGCSAHYVIDTRAMQWPGDSAALVLAPACGGLCCCGAFCASDLTLVVAPDTAVRTYAEGLDPHIHTHCSPTLTAASHSLLPHTHCSLYTLTLQPKLDVTRVPPSLRALPHTLGQRVRLPYQAARQAATARALREAGLQGLTLLPPTLPARLASQAHALASAAAAAADARNRGERAHVLSRAESGDAGGRRDSATMLRHVSRVVFKHEMCGQISLCYKYQHM